VEVEMKPYFSMLARYNQWANGRLYRMAAELPDEAYRRPVGAYFGSLNGTLNHLLTADSIWMHRLTGTGDHPAHLDAILFADLAQLQTAREAEDRRIIGYVEGLRDTDIEASWDYQTLNGTAFSQPLRDILAHLFNHQTHHRGQSHAILTALGVAEPAPLDLLLMQREQLTN
jgi:uncharacterized damage-inducible protein DinB